MDGQVRVELTLLGGWELRVDGVSQQMGFRQQRLVAVLAIFGRRSRSFLGGLLWPDCTEAHALGSLRAAVFTVSSRLPGLIACCGRELRLSDAVDVDLHRLRRALAGEDSEAVDAATPWFAGPAAADLLPGWYDDWVLLEQQRLHDDYLTVAECLAERALARHDHFRARHLAQAARAIDPLRESATRVLLATHLAMGNELTALSIFDEYCTVLARELGAAPAPQIVSVIAAVGDRRSRRGLHREHAERV